MAEGNGEIIEEMATTNKSDGNGEPERTPDYPKLVEYGLDKRVSVAICNLINVQQSILKKSMDYFMCG